MAINISQLKRENTIKEIDKLLDTNKDKKTIEILNSYKTELLSNKFGLVYDEYETKAVDVKNIHFIKNKNLSFENSSKNPHKLYIGDNLDTMRYLKDTEAGTFNIIYADPPYNTLANTLTYQDNMTPAQWCSFMEKRLVLMRDLLNEEGFIAISIGNAGQAQLKLIMDKVFGWENFVMHLPRITTLDSGATSKIIRQHDYLYVYAKNWKRAYYLLYEPFNNHISSLEFTKHIYSNNQGKKELEELVDFPFDAPKPVELIEKLLMVSPDKNLKVLDPFVGSGTTFQAAIEVNNKYNKNITLTACQIKEKIIDDEWKKIYPDIHHVTIDRVKKFILKSKSKDGFIVEEINE